MMERQKNMTDDVVVVVVVFFCEMKPLDKLQWHHDLYIVDWEEATLTMDGAFKPVNESIIVENVPNNDS